MSGNGKVNIRARSSVIMDGPDRAPARAMLRAVGLGDKELGQPFVGVSNLASDVTPCNVHLYRVVQAVRRGIGGGGWDAIRVRHVDGQRCSFDGDPGHESFAGEPGGDRRLD